MNRRNILTLIALDATLLGLGLAAPALIVYPSAGQLTEFLRIFTPGFDSPREVSIAGGIITLFNEGEIVIGSILLLFSVLFPLAKLGAMWVGVLENARNVTVHFAARLAKYSMLDVLVLALLVIAIKKIPGGSRIAIGPGAIFFAASVIISVFVPLFLKRSVVAPQN